MTTLLTALSLTPSARDWLVETTEAQVLSTHERACNLINQRRNVLSLVTTERGLTPFAIMVTGQAKRPFETVTTGDLVQVSAAALKIGELVVRLATLTLWNPLPDWPMLRKMFQNDPGRVRHLADIVMELAAPTSLLDLFRRESTPHAEMENALLARVSGGAVELLTGLSLGQGERAEAGAKRLAGAGPGVTPAGDDFLVGLCLAAWSGLLPETRLDQVASALEAACPLTTPLSAAYLRSAKRGECIAAWHTLFAALLLSDVEVVRMATKSLMSVGHSSGSDGLAGYLAAHYLRIGTL